MMAKLRHVAMVVDEGVYRGMLDLEGIAEEITE